MVTSSLAWACSTIVGDGGGVADRELVDQVVGFGGHAWSIDGTPDTGLTRGHRAYPAVVIAVSVLDVVELHRDGERIAGAPGQDRPRCSSAWPSKPASWSAPSG